MLRSETPKEVAAPGLEVNVQPVYQHFVPLTFMGCTCQGVNEKPLSASRVSPLDLNLGLRAAVAEINDDEVSFTITQPGPADKVLEACIIRPTRSLAQPPFAFAKDGVIDSF